LRSLRDAHRQQQHCQDEQATADDIDARALALRLNGVTGHDGDGQQR